MRGVSESSFLDDTSICTNIGGITDTNKDCIFDDGYKLPCIFNSRVDDYDYLYIDNVGKIRECRSNIPQAILGWY